MHLVIRRALLLGACALPFAVQAQDATLLHPMFQDHGVLQRDRPITIWGEGRAGETVKITLATLNGEARVDPNGKWRVSLPALPAGGPYTLAVKAGDKHATAKNVLIGDVWLCSGQSNMEFQVRHGLNADFEIASGADDKIRLLTVAKTVAPAPALAFTPPVMWRVANRDSIGDFSAACFFMGKDLRRSEQVPVGLIAASWGGTGLDVWRSEAALARDPAAKEQVELLRSYRADRPKAAANFAKNWEPWWHSKTNGAPQPWRANAPGEWKTVPAFEAWESWGVDALANFDGLVFYRTEIELTASQAAKGATLLMGPADDLDMTWVNEIGVGTDTNWGVAREYPLSAGTLRAGNNRIVVAIHDSWGNGGSTGTPDQRGIRFADGTVVRLPDPAGWQYQISLPSSAGSPPRAPWDAINGLAGIYNGMIAPIGPFGLRGIAWYQGESDTGRAADYAARLANMMQGWRDQFENPKLPFLIAQLAGWGPRNAEPIESGTASIREQQRRAVAADRNSALAVTVDLGDVTDIHPANKQDVGLRLARGARVLTYGAAHSASGPWPISAKREGDEIAIRFGAVDSKLAAFSGVASGFELCGEEIGSCQFVSASLSGNQVRLPRQPSSAATRVRYCWGNSPICNLSDATALPVTPFELDIE